MTAIGVNVTDRQAVNGWESIKPEPISRFVRTYKEKCNQAEAAWQWFFEMVDQWEDSRVKWPVDHKIVDHFRVLMVDAKIAAEAADREQKTAYKQMNCPHSYRETYGQVEICETCGAEF